MKPVSMAQLRWSSVRPVSSPCGRWSSHRRSRLSSVEKLCSGCGSRGAMGRQLRVVRAPSYSSCPWWAAAPGGSHRWLWSRRRGPVHGLRTDRTSPDPGRTVKATGRPSIRPACGFPAMAAPVVVCSLLMIPSAALKASMRSYLCAVAGSGTGIATGSRIKSWPCPM